MKCLATHQLGQLSTIAPIAGQGNSRDLVAGGNVEINDVFHGRTVADCAVFSPWPNLPGFVGVKTLWLGLQRATDFAANLRLVRELTDTVSCAVHCFFPAPVCLGLTFIG